MIHLVLLVLTAFQMSAKTVFVLQTPLVGEMGTMIAVANHLGQEIKIVTTDEMLDFVQNNSEGEGIVLHSLGLRNAQEIELFEALSLKERYFSANFFDPKIGHHLFDVVLNADHLNPILAGKVIEFSGIPSPLNPQAISPSGHPIINNLKGQEIELILLGGKSKSAEFGPDHAVLLAQLIKLRKAGGRKVVILDSRRTSEKTRISLLHSLLPIDFVFLGWDSIEEAGLNPYRELLTMAKSVIVTGDSMSMVADVLAIGKKPMVFAPKGSLEPRHQDYLLGLHQKGLISPARVDSVAEELSSPYNVAELIASKLKSQIRAKFCNQALTSESPN